MGAADCEAFVRGMVGNKLTDDELEKAFESYDKLRISFVNSGKTDNIEQRIANALVARAIDTKYRKAKARRQLIQNVTIFRERKAFIDQQRAAGYGPADAIYHLLEGGQGDEFGTRDSVDATKNAFAGKWIGNMMSEALDSNPAILKIVATDHKFDEQFAEELGNIVNGGTPGVTGNSDAQKFAEIVKRWRETSRLEYNGQGGMKEADDGWTDMSHDPYRMMEGNNPKEDWVEFVYNNLDVERTFKGIDPGNVDEIKDVLRRDFDRKVTGRHFGETEAAPTSKTVPSSLLDRFSRDGTYFWKDFESQKAYQRKYGHGTFISSIVHQMTQMARASALMQKFGGSPEIMLKKLSSDYVEILGNEMKNITDKKTLEKYAKWIRDLQYERLRPAVDEATGTAAIPSNVDAAKLGTGVRSVLTMSKMSNLIVSSTIGDSMNIIASATYGGQHGMDALKPWLRMFDGLDAKQRKVLALRFGEGMQGFIGSVYANAIETGPMNGGMAKMMDTYFKLIGVTKMFDHSRQAFVRERSVWLAHNRDKEFSQLDPFLQRGLTRNGIDSLRWDAIRSGPLEMVNGENYIMPESARHAEEKHILLIASPRIKEAYRLSGVDEAKMQDTKNKRLKAFEKRRLEIIEQTRYDLEMQTRKYFMDETNYAVIQPNAKSRRIARGAIGGARGVKPGSAIGEVLASMMMYKSFSIVNWDNMARAIENRNFLKMGAAGAGVLGRLLALQLIGGFVIEYAKDIAKGNWPPKAPWDPELASRALSTGGTMGMYGDYLISLLNLYDTPTAILGPEAEYLIRTAQLPVKMAVRKKGRTGEAINWALETTPFGNLMVARPVLDTILLDELRDWSSPGYIKRKKSKLKENGQHNIYRDLLQ